MNALQRARAFLGFTQGEMAHALGVSLATYQRREALADDYVPRTERAYAEALVAGAAIEYVFGEEDAAHE